MTWYNTKEDQQRLRNTLDQINAKAREIQHRRNNPTQADRAEQFETEEQKSARAFQTLDHLLFCQHIKEVERRFIKKLCDICDRALC